MTAAPPIDTLAGIAAMVRRLRPDWRDGEQFYELRSEIVAALMRLARQPAPAHVPVRTTAPAWPLTINRFVVAAAPPPRAPKPSPVPRPAAEPPLSATARAAVRHSAATVVRREGMDAAKRRSDRQERVWTPV